MSIGQLTYGLPGGVLLFIDAFLSSIAWYKVARVPGVLRSCSP